MIFFRAFFIRGLTAAALLFFNFSMASLLSTGEYSELAVAQSILVGIGILSRFGLNNLLIKYSARLVFEKEPMGPAFRVATLNLSVSLIFFVVFYFLLGFFSPIKLGEIVLSKFDVNCILATSFFLNVSSLLSSILRGSGRVSESYFLELNGFILFCMPSILFCYLISGVVLNDVYIIFLVVSLFLSVLSVVRGHVCCKIFDGFGVKEKLWEGKERFDFGVASVFEYFSRWGVVLLAGFFLISKDVAVFMMAHQIGLAGAFIMIVLKTYMSPKYAKLARFDDFAEEMKSFTARGLKVAYLYIAFISPFIFAICLNLDALLGFEVEYSVVIVVIAFLAQSVGGMSGSPDIILSMSGFHAVVRNASIFFGVMMVVMFVVFSEYYSLIGSVLAILLVMVVKAVYLNFHVKREIGFYPALPGFS